MAVVAQVRVPMLKIGKGGPGVWVGGFSSTEVARLRNPSQLTLCSLVSLHHILELSKE